MKHDPQALWSCVVLLLNFMNRWKRSYPDGNVQETNIWVWRWGGHQALHPGEDSWTQGLRRHRWAGKCRGERRWQRESLCRLHFGPCVSGKGTESWEKEEARGVMRETWGEARGPSWSIFLWLEENKTKQTWADKSNFQSVAPNLKEAYGTSRRLIVVSLMTSPYSFQWGISDTFFSLIEPSALPTSPHSWPVIFLFHGEDGSNLKRTTLSPPTPCLQGPASGLAVVTVRPFWSSFPCFVLRPYPDLCDGFPPPCLVLLVNYSSLFSGITVPFSLLDPLYQDISVLEFLAPLKALPCVPSSL